MKRIGLLLLFLFLIIIIITELGSKSNIKLYHIPEPCTKGLRFGYINNRGKVVIRPGWNEATIFTVEGLARVEGNYRAVNPLDCEAYMNYGNVFGSGNSRYRYGFIKPNGKYISRRLWGKAYNFHDGMASVGRGAEMAMGFINTRGKLVIREQWQEPGSFSDGMLPVEYSDKKNPERWQIVDKDGNPIPEPVMLNKPVVSEGMFYFSKNGKTMFYDLGWNFKFSIPYQTVEPFHEGIAVASHYIRGNILYGYVNISGKIILPAKYKRTEPFSDGLGMVKDLKDKYHFVDKQGRFVLKDLDYELAFPFKDGLALVHLNKKKKFRCGFINKQGVFVIPAKFFQLNEFSEGLAMACEGNSYANIRCGYINRSGRFVIKPRFKSAYSFSSGRAKVILKGERKQCFIDKNGRVVFKPQNYRWIKEFRDGVVKIEYKDSKFSYLNINGKEITKRRFKSASEYFSQGYGIVFVDNANSTFIDKNGKFLFPPQRMMAYPFKHGYAKITGLKIDGVKYRTVIIDTDGKVIHKWKHGRKVEYAGDKRFAMYYRPPSQYIYINKKGKQAIPRKFGAAYPFKNGYAIVGDRGKYCLINKKGKILIRFPYRDVSLNDGGFIVFYEGKKAGFMDMSGKVIVKPRFSHVDDLKEGAIAVCEKSAFSSKCGYINRKGEYLFSPRFSSMPPDFSCGLASFKDGSGKCGYYDKKGNVVINPIFYECEAFHKGLAWAAVKKKKYGFRGGYINKLGKFIWQQKSWLHGFWEAKPTYAYYNKSLNWGRVNYSQLQRAVFHETNRIRLLHGLPPFKYSYALERAAKGHSEDMVRLGFFAHESRVKGKKTVKQRLALAGVRGYWAENISAVKKGSTYGEFAREVVWGWATSPGHRLNILRKKLQYIGVGIVRKGHDCKSTQNFSNVRGP